MEQGTRLDSTRMSAAQDVLDDAGEDRALDAAVAALLTTPPGDAPSGNGVGEREHGAASKPAETVSPVLANLLSEWSALQNEIRSREMADEELDPKCARANELHAQICAFKVQSFADLEAKAPLYEHEHNDAKRLDSCESQEAQAWGSVLRDIASLSYEPAPSVSRDVDWNNPPPGFINIDDGVRRETERLDKIDSSVDLSEDHHHDVHPPSLLRKIAAESMLLANALIEYFGEKPIDKVLTTDIALRDPALRIRALYGNAASQPDAELLAIGEAWSGLVAEAERTLDCLDDAIRVYEAPEIPRELRVFNFDISDGFPLPYRTSTGYAPYGLEQVEELRATPRMGVFISGKPEGELLGGGGYRRVDQHAQKRAESIIAAWDVWRAEVDRRELGLNIPALRDAARAASEARDAAHLRARVLKAHTTRGLIVKAEIAAGVIPWRDRDAEAAIRDADDEVGILYTLVSDILKVLGGNDPRQARAS